MPRRRGMALRRKAIACCFLLLVLSQLQSSRCEAGLERVQRLRGGFGVPWKRPAAAEGGSGHGGGFEGGDGALAAEERKVFTGANPLHNR